MPLLRVLRRDDAAEGAAGEVLARPLTRLVVGEALGRLLSGAVARRPAVESGEAGSVPVSFPGARKMRELCHNLNNPLAVVMGQLEIITERHPDLPDDLNGRLKEIESAAESMKKLIAEARAVSEAGGE